MGIPVEGDMGGKPMSEQKRLDRPDREKIILLLSSGMLRSGDALNGEGELLEDDTYLFLTKKYKGVLADQIIDLIEEAKKQLIAHIEKNCKGYEDRTVGTLMDSAFWRSIKEEK